eukprot:7331818-Pyramimonas_sp.AAC.1
MADQSNAGHAGECIFSRRVRLVLPQLEAGNSYTLEVTSRDEFGNTNQAGLDNYTFDLVGMSNETCASVIPVDVEVALCEMAAATGGALETGVAADR